MDFVKGQIVIALKGKDKGQMEMVVEVHDKLVWVADGKHRRLEKPKGKNAKHLFITKMCVDVNSFTSNKQLSRTLCAMQTATNTKGGQEPCLKTM
ncbi:MAG: KOW domain-containing RNA-binding protein [Oscillospiraceae bacterium]